MGPSQCPRIDKNTYGIHRQNQACCRQARQESGGAGGVGLSLYHQLVQPAVFSGNSESVLRTESDFCGQARKQTVNHLIPTNLNK
jgi:hypothetical protein